MTWHLKNRELERLLNENNHPMHTFTDDLNKKAITVFSDNWPMPMPTSLIIDFQRLDKNGVILSNNSLEFSIDELEHIPDYNPNDWNEFPTVKPPKDVWMRIEDKDGWGTKAKWNGNNWINFAYDTISCTPEDKLRFRPWED